MKKTIPAWQMAGFIFTAVMGTFLHFLFDLTGGNVAAALFSAVNESIWEHLKLLFYPMVIFAIVAHFSWGKDVPSFWCVKLMGILLGLVLIPVIYYTYTGILGVNADWFNITIFFLVAGIVFWAETKLLQKRAACPLGTKLSVTIILLLAVIFTVFTFLPPHIPFFRDPVTETTDFANIEEDGLAAVNMVAAEVISMLTAVWLMLSSLLYSDYNRHTKTCYSAALIV